MPITHQRLKTLSLCGDLSGLKVLLCSLTLPGLQEFHTDQLSLLTTPYIPAFIQHSSCPLTGITLCDTRDNEFGFFNSLRPLPGVTDITLEWIFSRCCCMEEYVQSHSSTGTLP